MMRSFIRRTTTLAVLGALAVGSSLPAAAESGVAERVTQRQSILTELSNTGEAGTSRVFTQLSATGNGPVTVSLPQQSTSGLRSLDGFGAPDVNGDEVVWTLDASKGGSARSVADNTADLPVSLAVTYRLDGEEISPRDLAGKTGQVEVEYVVSNLTAEPREIISFDAENNKTVETVDIAVPMVGSLALNLGPRFANINAPGAVTAGDGRGNTVVQFSLLLFAPLGSDVQTVTWTADAQDILIPETRLQVLPVDDRSFNSLGSTADAYKGAMGSLSTLGNGALILDSNVQLLGAGASQLLDGLGQLADGAGKLSDGLANSAAPGARELSAGMSKAREGGGKLSTGLGELSLGADRLADGLGAAREGGDKLANGLGDLSTGAGKLSDGLGAAEAGGTKLSAGLGDLAAGMTRLKSGTAELAPGLEQLADGAGQLAANTPTLAAGAGTLSAGIDQIAAGAAGFEPAANGLESIAAGLAGVNGGVDRLIAAVAKIRGAVGNVPGCDTADPSTTCGVLDGLDALETGILGLEAGIAGSIQPLLNTAGCDPLAVDPATCGSAQLAGTASGVSTDVAAGIGQAIDGLTPLTSHSDPVVAGTAAAVIAGLNDAQAGAAGAASLAGGASQKTAGASGALSPAGPIGGGLGQLGAGVDKLQDGITRVDAGSPADAGFNPGLQQALTLTLGGLTNPACSLADPTNAANPCGLKQVVDGLLLPGSNELATGLAPALRNLAAAFGTTADPGALTAGAQAIAAGTRAVDGGIQQLAPGAEKAAAGAAALDDGAGQLATGAGAASAGSQDLVAGLGQLDDGAGQLAAGADKAAAGAGDLGDGLRQLDEGGGKLAAGAGKAASGSRDLASGLVQLDDGAAKLATGLGDAADGSIKLAEGLVSAEEGGGKIADGTAKLSKDGFGSLIEGISGGRQGASADYETVRAVIQRGREGVSAYGVADGAEATTVYQFDLAGVGTEEGPSTPLLVVLALVALTAAGGLGLALKRRLAA